MEVTTKADGILINGYYVKPNEAGSNDVYCGNAGWFAFNLDSDSAKSLCESFPSGILTLDSGKLRKSKN